MVRKFLSFILIIVLLIPILGCGKTMPPPDELERNVKFFQSGSNDTIEGVFHVTNKLAPELNPTIYTQVSFVQTTLVTLSDEEEIDTALVIDTLKKLFDSLATEIETLNDPDVVFYVEGIYIFKDTVSLILGGVENPEVYRHYMKAIASGMQEALEAQE